MENNYSSLSVFDAFKRDVRGVFALKFALVLTPILVGVGVAVDMSRTVSVKTKLQNAADAATLTARMNMESSPKEWREIATQTFEENIQNIPLKGTPNLIFSTPEADIVQLKVQGHLKPQFIQIFGYPRLGVGVESVARASEGSGYLSVVFLIDHSYSMGIGANDSYISDMDNASGCAFSCHYRDGAFPETFTRNNDAGAKLRIDVVRRGLLQAVDEFEKNVSDPEKLEVSAYAFGNELKELLAPTSDFEEMRNGMRKVELTADKDFFGTNLRQIMIDLSETLPPSGDGSSSLNRKSIIVLLTDGIEDNTFTKDMYISGSTVTNWVNNPEFERNNSFWEDMQALDRGFCRPVKRYNHEIIPIQIEYVIPQKGVPAFERPHLNHIEDNLLKLSSKRARECATSDQYYEVSESYQIREALKDIAVTLSASTELYVSR